MAQPVSIPIPVICRVCGAVFPGPIAIGIGSTINLRNNLTTCPNGHMTPMPEGSFSVVPVADGILRIAVGEYGQPADLAQLLQLTRQAVANSNDSEAQRAALDEISKMLPEASRAAIKNLGSKNPTVVLIAILFILTTVAGNLGPLFKQFFPSEPSPATVINNYNETVINTSTPSHLSGQTIGNVSVGDGGQTASPQRAQGGAAQAPKQPPISKPKSHRRADVNRARRQALKLRRQQFSNRHH